MIGIYKITSPTNKIYIGQSWNIEGRKSKYKSLSCEKQKKLYASLKKHGFENHNFEIICELGQDTTQEILDKKEIFYIKYYKDLNYILLNIKEGGSSGKHTEYSKLKISNAHKGKGNGMFGVEPWNKGKKGLYKVSDENKKIQSERQKGGKRSPETKQKMSNSAKGKIFSETHRKNLSNSRKGKIVPWNKGKKGLYKASDETKKKLSEAGKIKILQFSINDNFIKEFDSVKNASLELNIFDTNICRALKCNSKTCKGFKWKYKYDIFFFPNIKFEILPNNFFSNYFKNNDNFIFKKIEEFLF